MKEMSKEAKVRLYISKKCFNNSMHSGDGAIQGIKPIKHMAIE
jgi:hypothetical protein